MYEFSIGYAALSEAEAYELYCSYSQSLAPPIPNVLFEMLTDKVALDPKETSLRMEASMFEEDTCESS